LAASKASNKVLIFSIMLEAKLKMLLRHFSPESKQQRESPNRISTSAEHARDARMITDGYLVDAKQVSGCTTTRTEVESRDRQHGRDIFANALFKGESWCRPSLNEGPGIMRAQMIEADLMIDRQIEKGTLLQQVIWLQEVRYG
jgi:hypothetical protein